MTEIYRKPIAGPSAWKSAEMRARADWVHVLTEAEIGDLDQALRAVQKRGLAMAAVYFGFIVWVWTQQGSPS